MGFLRGYECDYCKVKEFSYKPTGWRMVDFERRTPWGVTLQASKVMCCSQGCEDKWEKELKREWREIEEDSNPIAGGVRRGKPKEGPLPQLANDDNAGNQ